MIKALLLLLMGVVGATGGLTESNVRQALAGVRCDEQDGSYTYSRACLREVKVSEPWECELPMSTFSEIEPLADFARQECMSAGICWTATHVPTRKAYSIWQTAEDGCDGGNSYGIMVDGRTPVKGNVIRIIRDSDLSSMEGWE